VLLDDSGLVVYAQPQPPSQFELGLVGVEKMHDFVLYVFELGVAEDRLGEGYAGLDF
jgi:hypothetical protein